jgi:voltage-gated sodium channel
VDKVVDTCRSIIDSERFQFFIIGVIVINAISLGLATFDSIEASSGPTLILIDQICLGIYVVELVIRFVSYGRHPADFFKSGWNVFDFVVIGSVFIPGLASQTALLRVLRVLRVARILRYLPDLQVLAQGLLKALRPLSGLLVLTIILLFLYGMAGWSFFHNEAPEYWSNIGRSMLTLFTVLTLEGWPDIMYPLLDLSPWVAVYFISFVLIATFIVFNMVIGVILNSLDTAHKAQNARQRAAALADDGVMISDPKVLAHLETLREAIEDLEIDLAMRDQPADGKQPAGGTPPSAGGTAG